MTDLVLDPSKSRVRLHTFAEGILARLAHDLELVCGELTGTATKLENGGGTASIEIPLRGMSVSGVLGKDGSIDERGLSPSDRRECLAKMHKDVFHARPDAVIRVEVHVEGDSARVRVTPPNGKSVEAVIRAELHSDGTDGGLRSSGKLEVSLSAIGSDTVKGPMGAFRVKDKVVVSFDVVFRPQVPKVAQPA